jgi:putative endonuclease
MAYIVYVLKSETTGLHYTGQTHNLELRITAHNQGESRYTKGRGPWVLVYQEECTSRSEAMKRERFLKSGQGRAFLKARFSIQTYQMDGLSMNNEPG